MSPGPDACGRAVGQWLHCTSCCVRPAFPSVPGTQCRAPFLGTADWIILWGGTVLCPVGYRAVSLVSACQISEHVGQPKLSPAMAGQHCYLQMQVHGFAGLGRLGLVGTLPPVMRAPTCTAGAEGSSGEENCLSRFNLQFPLSSALELCLLCQAKPMSSRCMLWERQWVYLLSFHAPQSLWGGTGAEDTTSLC